MSRYDANIMHRKPLTEQYLGEISDLKRGILEMKKEILLRDEKLTVHVARIRELEREVTYLREELAAAEKNQSCPN